MIFASSTIVLTQVLSLHETNIIFLSCSVASPGSTMGNQQAPTDTPTMLKRYKQAKLMNGSCFGVRDLSVDTWTNILIVIIGIRLMIPSVFGPKRLRVHEIIDSILVKPSLQIV